MKHAAIVPLAGGAAIGASLALKRPPEYMASWDVFAHNDSYCRQYYPEVPFHDAKTIKKVPKVDIITCVPPCSGLSTATPSTARGCKAPQNEHMLSVAEVGMIKKTFCIVIENAPTLYSKGGEQFAVRFLPLCKKYGYSMVLYKTSTILHGLPQNRVRSFVILYKGVKIPEFNWINKSYTPLHSWKVENNSQLSNPWRIKDDELINLVKKKVNGNFLKKIYDRYQGPITAWRFITDNNLVKKFKTKPYDYMAEHYLAGDGIMDRSPYLVWDHCNALMWKSAHKMINPAKPSRQFNIREMMNLMGLPKNYKEIPAKDINVLFQNVPVTTVKTLVEEIIRQFSSGRGWYRPTEDITRINNIKQTIEIF